ncbi:hypothetical protein [Bradyrhizobium sediminis]|uniref:hypothetical protein n=1 Tax=Bradyrhizobium sediminis TaxID=2840469 RepID=UPI00201C9373|nr:hypothetical protein [Bradyrhizobium sediminis]
MARAPVLAAGGIVLRQEETPLVAVVRLRKRNEWAAPPPPDLATPAIGQEQRPIVACDVVEARTPTEFGPMTRFPEAAAAAPAMETEADNDDRPGAVQGRRSLVQKVRDWLRAR